MEHFDTFSCVIIYLSFIHKFGRMHFSDLTVLLDRYATLGSTGALEAARLAQMAPLFQKIVWAASAPQELFSAAA
jgi:hypothetical protein